jgi:hypothetical protein
LRAAAPDLNNETGNKQIADMLLQSGRHGGRQASWAALQRHPAEPAAASADLQLSEALMRKLGDKAKDKAKSMAAPTQPAAAAEPQPE